METRIYLDNAATTACDRQVLAAMLPYFENKFGNASSQHQEGGEGQKAIQTARQQVANLIGAKSEEIIFTGSGTEANNTALQGAARGLSRKGNHIITSKIEHPSVLEPIRFLEKEGFQATYLPVDEFGSVNAQDVEQAITDNTILISIMHANNEVGTIQPIRKIGRIAAAKKIYLHTDAVQTAGSLPVDVNDLNVNLLSISAHKLRGPKGVGALYIKAGTYLVPLLHGGDQESRKRASTENVPGIVGFGRAAELAMKRLRQGEEKRLEQLRDRLIEGILANIDRVKLNGHEAKRLPGNINVSVEYIEGESMVLHLDAQGIAASSGSACSSSDLKPSHVLLAMGLSHEMAHGSLRFSLGKETTKTEIDRVIAVLPGIVEKLRAMSPLMPSKQKAYA